MEAKTNMKVLLLLLMVQPPTVNSLLVLKSLEPFDKPDPFSGAELRRISVLNDSEFSRGITFCGRFNFLRFPQELLQIGSRNPFPFIRIKRKKLDKHFHLSIGDVWFEIKNVHNEDNQLWITNQWQHFCLAFNVDTLHISLIKDGQSTSIDNTKSDLDTTGLKSGILDHFVVGFSNLVSDFNIWDYPLKIAHMKLWTSCSLPDHVGNIATWTEAQWELKKVKQIDTKLPSLCNAPKTGLITFLEKMSFPNLKQMCKRFGGKAFAIESQKSLQQALEITEDNDCVNAEYLEVGSMIWSGWSDQADEGIFVNQNDPPLKLKESNMSDAWKKGEPNGGGVENCVLMETNYGLADVPCSRQQCGICDIPMSQLFHMRGICQDSNFDFDYSWTGEQAKKYTFVGVRNEGLLFWDDNKKYWKLENIKDKQIFAILNETENAYPIGTHVWYVFNDNCKNEGVEVAPNVYKTEMSFSVCNEDMFNCRDGTCINIAFRCDGKSDCPDLSDEMECQFVEVIKPYMKTRPPPSAMFKKGEFFTVEDKLEIYTTIQIKNILEVDEVRSSLTLQLKLELRWIDSRHKYFNLNKKSDMNTLSVSELEEIWTPDLLFVNTKEKHANLKNESTAVSIEIIKENSALKNPSHEIFNGFWHQGKDCHVKAKKYMTVNFICFFDMHHYPFDTQVCKNTIMPVPNSDTFVKLIGKDIIYDGPWNLMKYDVNITLEDGEVVDSSAIHFVIRFERQLLNALITIMLPTILIILVSFGTNYSGFENFAANRQVNMTGMLVTATLYLAVNGNLPTTSSLKMIDLWMLFSLAIPFMEIILHTSMAWIRQKYELENTKDLVGIAGGNKTDELYGRIARPQKDAVKHLIKEVVTATPTNIWDNQDQPRTAEIDTKEPQIPIIVWNQKAEPTWPKRVFRMLEIITFYGLPVLSLLFVSGFFVTGIWILK